MTTSVAPGDVLQSKYRVDSKIEGMLDAYAGSSVGGGPDVLIFEITPGDAAAMERAKGVEHIHLARLLDLVEVGDARYAIAERLPGLMLAARLDDIGKKESVDAVRSALRIADALSSLHEAGACHGSVHPRGILIQVEGHAPPVLGYFPSEDTAYRSPDRPEGAAPTEADDAWAAAALLHTMLLGDPPPAQGYASESALHEAGVSDAALCAALAHALNQNPDARSRDVRPLKRELARWFVEHAGEEPTAPGPHSTHPPPLPMDPRPGETLGATTSAPPPRTKSAAPPPQKSFVQRILPLAVGGVLVGLVGGWVFNVVRAKPKVVVVAKASAETAPAASEKPIDLGEVPVTGENATPSSGGTADKLSSCVMAYLPKGTFAKAPDFSGMCDETDPRPGADKLRVAVVGSAPKASGPTDAMKIFARIGWYDMAAYAVVRAGCCPEAKPLVLPEPSNGCEPMDAALREIGQAVVSARPSEEPLKKYTAAIHCEMNAGRGQQFRKRERPVGGEDSAFLELVKAIQTP